MLQRPTNLVRSSHRHVDQAADTTNVCDLYLIYNRAEPRGDPRFASSSKKYPLSSNVVESVVLQLPAPKKKMLKVQPRSQFNSNGESTTHDTTYSGCAVRSFSQLPKLSAADKSKALGQELKLSYRENVQLAVADVGMPLFWQEWKTVQFWTCFFADLQVTHVLDLTAGSGAAGVAALYSGCFYEGFAMNATHQAWLNNVLDMVGLPSNAHGQIEANARLGRARWGGGCRPHGAIHH